MYFFFFFETRDFSIADETKDTILAQRPPLFRNIMFISWVCHHKGDLTFYFKNPPPPQHVFMYIPPIKKKKSLKRQHRLLVRMATEKGEGLERGPKGNLLPCIISYY